MFHLCNNQFAFSLLSNNTPDVIEVMEESREVSVLERAWTFDSSLYKAIMTKVIKHQQLINSRLFVLMLAALDMYIDWLSVDDAFLGCPRGTQRDSQSIAPPLPLLAATIYGGGGATWTCDCDLCFQWLCPCYQQLLSHFCAISICVPECIITNVDINKLFKMCVCGRRGA